MFNLVLLVVGFPGWTSMTQKALQASLMASRQQGLLSSEIWENVYLLIEFVVPYLLRFLTAYFWSNMLLIP